jgi:hypothetical protein
MTAYTNKQLFDAISELRVIDQEKLDAALKDADEKEMDLGELLLERDLITDGNLGKVLSELLNIPLVRLDQISIPSECLAIVPEEVARNQMAIAFGRDEAGIKLAMLNPKNEEFAQMVGKKAGAEVKIYLATKRDLDAAL